MLSSLKSAMSYCSYAQMDCSVLKKRQMGSEWIWTTRRTPAASDEVQEVCGSTGNDY